MSNLAPKDNFVLRLEGKTRTTKFSYNSSGEKVRLGEELNNITLDQNIFSSLSVFGAGATLGTTSSSMLFDSQRFELSFGYGITENLTIGMIVPFGTVNNSVKFSLSGATLGINPSYNSGLAHLRL